MAKNCSESPAQPGKYFTYLTKPDRGAPEPPPEALPADLVHLLLTRVRLSEAEVAAMSKDEAMARMQRYWAMGS
jgi:hypothetical protein